MKKEELTASLDQIRPREELINSTLAQIHAQKAEMQTREEQREARRSAFFPSAVYHRGLRVAGAVCAFALVFSMGFAVARLGGVDPATTPDNHLAGTLDTDNVSNNYGVNAAAYSAIATEEWIAIRGSVASVLFTDLTEEQRAMGALAGGEVTFAVQSIEGRSEEFSRETISAEITAEVLLYDTESLNTLVNRSDAGLLIRLIPTENGGWEVHDFYPAE